jgi:hypothetical protein
MLFLAALSVEKKPMPVSSGLRSRPQIRLMRSISSRRAFAGGIASMLPRFIVLPIIVVGMVTAALVALWTYGIHIDASVLQADGPAAVGQGTKAN